MDQRTFEDLTIVNLCQGLPGLLLGKFCAELGGKVVRPELPADKAFAEIYPAWRVLMQRQEQVPAIADDLLEDPRVAHADICLLGGEDLPGVVRKDWAAALSDRYPRLIVVEIGSYPRGSGRESEPATDILMQAATGLASEQFDDRPVMMAFRPAIYGSTLLALIGMVAALVERESSSRGQAVFTSLYEGAVLWRSPFWYQAEKSPKDKWISRPKSAKPLIFKCADGQFVHISLSTPGALAKLEKVLGIDGDRGGKAISGSTGDDKAAAKFYGDPDRWGPLIAAIPSRELLSTLDSAGVSAEPCLRPGECWHDPQVAGSGIIERGTGGEKFVGNPISLASSGEPAKPPAMGGKEPLSGIRVIDLGTFVAGPLASVALADLGADIIKVESFSGDATRTTFWWNTTVNRGKRNIQLDLKAPSGREVFGRLCEKADIVTHNYRVGVTNRLKIDAASLRNDYPHLSMLEAPAYGLVGPKSLSAGVDMTMQALCGHEYRAGGDGNPPLWNRLTFVDITAGLLGSVAALLCIYHRAKTLESSLACVSLLDAGLFLLSELFLDADGTAHGAPPINHSRTGYNAAEAFYRTSDHWIAISASDRGSWSRLLAALQIQDGVTEPLKQSDDRAQRRIAEAIQSRSTDAILKLLKRNDVWCVPLHDGDLMSTQALISLFSTEDPNFGTVHQIRNLFKLSRSPMAAPAGPPKAGAHSAEILEELGYGTEDAAKLFDRDVVR